MNLTLGKTVGLLILAGGKATRLQTLLDGRPKSLIHFPPWQPVLLDLVKRASQRGMEVCLATDPSSFAAIDSYMWEQGQHTQISVDSGQGTGNALRVALERMESPTVIVCNADTIIPFDILAFGSEAPLPNLPVRQILTPFSTQNSGLIGVSRDVHTRQVVHWGETTGTRPAINSRAASSSGAYVIQRKQWLGNIDPNMGSLENAIMPALVSERIVEAYITETILPTYDFGVPNRIRALQRDKALLNLLLSASGADHPNSAGYCLPGVRIA